MGFPPEIYDIIMAIQASFFLSHKIRTNTEVLLAFVDDELVVQYIGSELRFLSPDERSIGMLLMKALEKKDAAHKTKIQSTPGIWIQKKKIKDFFHELSEKNQIIIADEDFNNELQGIFEQNITFIIPNFFPVEKYFSDRIVSKFKIKDLPINRRNYLAILKFHSLIDNSS